MFGQQTNRGVRRAHSPDFFDGGYHTSHGPQQPFRGPQFNKRHRANDYQPQTLEDRIARLGDTGSRNSEIGLLAKDIDIELANKANEEEKTKNITAKICRCIVAFPTRVATYATLIGLISVKHYNVSCQIINALHASYPVYLEAQKWQEALTIIHLLSSLVNCKVIRPSALISQFELLLEVTLEDNVPQARVDYYVYTVLSSLPYVALELSADPEQQPFEQILNTIETYLSKRSKEHLNVTRVWLSSDSTIQMDYLDSLWVQTKNFRANGWNEVFLHRPYNDKEYKDIMASSLIPLNSPTIQIPAHSDNYVYPPPRIVFRLFEDDVVEGHRSIPGSDKIERFCIENHIRNIIDEIPKDIRDCARHLSHMYRSDQLPMKHLLIETLLGELFTLPRPRHAEILYHSLIYEFSRIFQTSRIPEEMKYNYEVLLNEAVKILYENLDTMSITCLDRFVQWFTYHLNATDFLFPWQMWTDATTKDLTSPKAVFVQAVLDRCIRFSYHKKVQTLVETYLSNLVPPETSVKYSPVFADHPKAEELANTVKDLVSTKADGKRICETLNIVIEGVELPEDFVPKEEKHSDKLLKIDIFTAVILSFASKSLTHLSSAIGKYKNVFKAIINIEEGQVQLLRTIHSCLETQPQLEVILVDKLLKADLIEAKEVCNWVFSQSMRPHHLKSQPWELLNNTISRVTQSVDKLLKERNELEVKPEKPPLVEDDVDMKQEPQDGAENETDDNEMRDQAIAKVQEQCKELIVQIFKMFSELLGDHIRQSEIANKSYMDDWYRWITGRMQQVFYTHHDYIYNHHDEVRRIIDEIPSIGSSIFNLNQ